MGNEEEAEIVISRLLLQVRAQKDRCQTRGTPNYVVISGIRLDKFVKEGTSKYFKSR